MKILSIWVGAETLTEGEKISRLHVPNNIPELRSVLGLYVLKASVDDNFTS